MKVTLHKVKSGFSIPQCVMLVAKFHGVNGSLAATIPENQLLSMPMPTIMNIALMSIPRDFLTIMPDCLAFSVSTCTCTLRCWAFY